MASNTATTIDWKTLQKEMEALFGPSAETADASTPEEPSADYTLSDLQTKIGDAQKKLETAQGTLSNYYTTRYDQEYNARGLGDVKNKITGLDSKIASEKTMRDESMSKVRKNPYYSAATITGEAGEIERLANARINNYIDERNGLAGEYNGTLDEVTKKVAAETAEKERDVENLKESLSGLKNQYSNYQSELSKQLEKAEDTKRWESEFMLKLQDAEQRAKDANKPSGGGSSNQTADERMSSRIAQGLEPDPTLRATAQRLINQGISDPTRLGYSGDLAVQLESEMGWINKQNPQNQSTTYASPVQGTTKESAFRREVRDAWKEGYSPDELKQIYGGVNFSDSNKSVSEIIDDEWKVKNEPGLKGWWDRLWRIGV
jgi:DNA repair exonuclease SbcCD ATPase subunit